MKIDSPSKVSKGGVGGKKPEHQLYSRKKVKDHGGARSRAAGRLLKQSSATGGGY